MLKALTGCIYSAICCSRSDHWDVSKFIENSRITPRIRNVSYRISIARAFKIYTIYEICVQSMGAKFWYIPLRFLYMDTFLIWVLSYSRNYTVLLLSHFERARAASVGYCMCSQPQVGLLSTMSGD